MEIFKGLKKYLPKIILTLVTLFINVLSVLYIPRLSVDLIDTGVASGDMDYIINTGLKMIIVTIIGSLSMVISARNSTFVAASFAADLRSDLFKKIENLSVYDFDKIGASSLIVRMTGDISKIQNLVRMGLRTMVRAPFMLVGALIMAYSTNSRLMLVFVALIFVIFIIFVISMRFIIPKVEKMRTQYEIITANFRERLTGVRVIRAFSNENLEEEKFNKINKDYSDIILSLGNVLSVFEPLIHLMFNMTYVAIIYFGSKFIFSDNMKPGEIIGFIQYSASVMAATMMLTSIFQNISTTLISVNRVNEILDLEDGFTKKSIGEKLEKIESIEFNDVCFKYPDSKLNALEDINFKLNKNDRVGIIGSTGSGKTTLTHLILGLYHATSGEILINNKNINSYDIRSVREKIALMEQKPYIISGDVKKNITMGATNIDNDKLDEALKLSKSNFIIESEKGAEEEVNQKGTNFSGGQKQRISIARAIYKDPEVFIIDDSFSALDYKTERELRDDLLEKYNDRMIIMITQRARVIYNFDMILVMDEGKIVDRGTHDYLKEHSKVYREILESQDFYKGEKNGEK